MALAQEPNHSSIIFWLHDLDVASATSNQRREAGRPLDGLGKSECVTVTEDVGIAGAIRFEGGAEMTEAKTNDDPPSVHWLNAEISGSHRLDTQECLPA
jgi:hypothetical protein